MKQVIFVAILATLFVTSCKNEKKETPAIPVDNVKVTFDLISKVPETLELFYVNDTTWSFNREQILRQTIKGDSISQLVNFEIPNGMIPTYIRLDFTNNDQDVVVINSFKMTYKDKVFVAQDSLLSNYFSANNVEIDNKMKSVKVLKDKQDFDPFIYSTLFLKENFENAIK
jgi:hypothetical protein